MLDWIGSLQVRERTPRRVVLSLSRSTQTAGAVLLALGIYLAVRAWSLTPWLALAPALIGGVGGLLATLRRSLTIDRSAGVLELEQRAFGVASRAIVPLFHLRAVVIVARPRSFDTVVGSANGSRYIAYLDRRVGDAIYLDEARRCAGLMQMAEAIAEVAELRLEYEATPAMD